MENNNYISLIDDGGNTSKTTDLKEFIVLILGFVLLFFSIFFMANFFVHIYIDNISTKDRIVLEDTLSKFIVYPPYTNDYKYELSYLENVKSNFIKYDSSIVNLANKKILLFNNKDVNAFIMADGTIYFTKGLLDKVKNKKELNFILAHEIGHYAHKDHLKSIGTELILMTLSSLFNIEINSLITSGVSDVTLIKYSQNQEKQADIYAAKMMKQAYGYTIQPEVFFKSMIEMEKLPQFMYYFSTHPSISDRIENIKSVVK